MTSTKSGKATRKNGANRRRRANNTGTLERRGDKWRARYYIRTPEGKQIRKTKTLEADSLEEAREELKNLTRGNALISRETELERNRVQMEGVRAELQQFEDTRPALALADMFAVFSASPERPQKCGEDTMAMYESQISRFVSWMQVNYPEAQEMRQVSREVAYSFLADLAGKVSPNTYNKYAALLRCVWKTLGEEAKCTSNPWAKVQRKTQPKTNGRRALTVAELGKVTANLTGEMRVLFAIGIYTGLRLGDCATLDWGSIDLARRLIVTAPRKTAKHQTIVEIPIHPTLGMILADIPETNRTGYVLPHTAELYLRDNSALSLKVQDVFTKAGIETGKRVNGYSQAVARVGFHSLRHSFVSLMGNAGAPLSLVQSIVGHSNPMMTAHYFHARTDALANAVANIPALMGSDAATETHDVTTDGEAATDAPEEAAERGDAIDGTTDGETAATPLAAFYAAFRALSPEDRETARAWIATETATN